MRLVLLALALFTATPSWAGDTVVPAGDIVEALAGTSQGQPLMRGLGRPERGAKSIQADRADRLRAIDGAGAAGLTAESLEMSARLLSDLHLAATDLPVEFAFGSAALSDEGYRQLNELGAALTSERLAAASFIVAGHTDAVGSDEANRRLSKRRADAVRNYLVEAYGIDRARLIALGFGETMPRNSEVESAAENRRVEVQAFVTN